MATSLRLRCTKKEEMEYGTTFEFTPDYGTGSVKKNQEWAKATPIANLRFQVKSELANLHKVGDSVEVLIHVLTEVDA